jgi:hypothetical protein
MGLVWFELVTTCPNWVRSSRTVCELSSNDSGMFYPPQTFRPPMGVRWKIWCMVARDDACYRDAHFHGVVERGRKCKSKMFYPAW